MTNLTAIALASIVAFGAEDAADPATKPVVHASIADVGVETRWLLPDSVLTRDDCEVKLAADVLAKRFDALDIDGRFGAAKQYGDVLRIAREALAGGTSVDDVMLEIAEQRPELAAAFTGWIEPLLRADGLAGDAWSPDDESDDDGMRIGARLPLTASDGEPWSSLDGTRVLTQGSTLVFADLATIKAVERDYAAYRERAGAAYESIAMKPDSWRTGEAQDVGAFTLHHMEFRADLPFPFTTYSCDLTVLDRVDAAGRLRADVYSTSPDFHWLAGTDVYLPVEDSDGTLVAWLLVRVFGFDLDDVPDGDSDREAAIRAGIGNLKRLAERRPRTAAAEPTTPAGLLAQDAQR